MSVERPLLMTGPLVQKTMAGLKTQTRRLVSLRTPGAPAGSKLERIDPAHVVRGGPVRANDYVATYIGGGSLPGGRWHKHAIGCPYGGVGDRLWVRETFCFAFEEPGGLLKTPETFLYRADGIELSATEGSRWLPSIHMPRRASRLTLKITEVRMERVQDISEEDARQEGIEALPNRTFDGGGPAMGLDARTAFMRLWDSINKGRLLNGKPITWDMNPWVWVLHFKVV